MLSELHIIILLLPVFTAKLASYIFVLVMLVVILFERHMTVICYSLL